ncbi:MAG: radical SAM protein, partial [Acidobacteriota bacterium]
IYLFCSTNGLLLNTEDKLQRLVSSGIDEITFSVDGARQETYEIYRRGGDFRKVFGIMKRLVEIKKEQNSETPFINWRYILFRWNDSDEEMDLARRLAAEIDIDKLCWEITDHPENSASERFVAGKNEYESIRHEIWSALGNAMQQKTLHATIHPKGNPWRAKPGQSFQGMIEVMNSGGAVWKNASQKNRRHITLGIQLLNRQKQLINRDFARLILPRPLSTNEREMLELRAQAPEQKGSYWLKLDMVCEGIEWFESCGSQPVCLELQVQ